jgi:hypothetical protein
MAEDAHIVSIEVYASHEGPGIAPVYVECKLHVTCVRFGHDASDLVELLALQLCED